MNRQINNTLLLNILLLIFSTGLVLLSWNFPFYWDNTVQISVPANWYYQNDFKDFFLPDNIATGHPAFVGMLLAFIWKIFGRSLLVSHLFMLPFIYGLLVQIKIFLKNIGIRDFTKLIIILIIIILDTSFLSQLSLITFDIIQLFFFFLCLNSILTNKNRIFTFCFVLLMLTSLRGSMMAIGIIIFNIMYIRFHLKHKIRIIDYIKYIPGIISLILFLIAFKLNKGWIIHNTVSGEWENAGDLASFSQVLRNIAVFIWRLIDFGRIGIFIVILFFLIKTISIRKFQDEKLKILTLVILSQLVIFSPVLILSQNPFGHRYLLHIIIPAIVIAVHWIQDYFKKTTILLLLITMPLLFGHFLIYPLKISQGWDSTTLHWNYFRVSQEMNSYIIDNKIDKSNIGTFFPNRTSRYLTHLESDPDDNYSGIPFEDKYILFSNTFNVEDQVIDSLFSKNSKWTMLKTFTKNRIFLTLYINE